MVTDADWLRSAIGRDHFSFNINPIIKDLPLVSNANVGDTSVAVKGPNPVKAGGTVIISKEVYRVTDVNGARASRSPLRFGPRRLPTVACL